MTPDELKKEAERITFAVKYEPEMEDEAMKSFILEKLRAVHDAAIEKAASSRQSFEERMKWIAATEHEKTLVHGNLNGFASHIRALKLSSEAGGNG